jgi:hypothetical protein
MHNLDALADDVTLAAAPLFQDPGRADKTSPLSGLADVDRVERFRVTSVLLSRPSPDASWMLS